MGIRMRTSRIWTRSRKLVQTVSLLNKRLVRRALLRGVTPATEHLPLLSTLPLRAVIDVGANRGQFTIAALVVHPNLTVVAIEPLKEAAATFHRIFSAHRKVRLVNAAAGRLRHEAQLFITRSDDSSSLRKPTAEQTTAFLNTDVIASRVVRVDTLDSLVEWRNLPHPVLLKLDVQGAELDVLSGAPGVLACVDFILAEASLRELYDGQPLLEEVVTMALALGFRLRSAHNATVSSLGEVVQLDLLFEAYPE